MLVHFLSGTFMTQHRKTTQKNNDALDTIVNTWINVIKSVYRRRCFPVNTTVQKGELLFGFSEFLPGPCSMWFARHRKTSFFFLFSERWFHYLHLSMVCRCTPLYHKMVIYASVGLFGVSEQRWIGAVLQQFIVIFLKQIFFLSLDLHTLRTRSKQQSWVVASSANFRFILNLCSFSGLHATCKWCS